MEDLLMKAATVIAVALATFSSFPSTAQQATQQQPSQQQPMQQQPMQQQPMQQPTQQQPDQQNQQPSGATAPTTPGSQSQPGSASSGSVASAVELKPVTGQLVGNLDTKSAKRGDSVVVKTEEDVKASGGADIPKGSKLMGHITNVQARGEGKENSQVAIQFDKAELKGGQTVAIESVIQSVSPASGSGAENGLPNAPGANPAAPSTSNGTTSSSSSATSTNGSSSSMSQNNSRPGSETGATGQPGQTEQSANSGTPAPGTIVARNGNVAIRMTAIPGVLLANALNGQPFANASGLLVGARRDIHLDEGTRMVVAVAGNPQGSGGMSR
jgi:hypothetical protein